MNKITFVLESLCEIENPRALSAYHFIDQLSATGHQISIITIYENKNEFEFKSSNIQILRPLNRFNLWQNLKAISRLLNHPIDFLHVFAPFTQPQWKSMRELATLASFTKAIPHIKNSFSGYDPTFHNWSVNKLKKLDNYFDVMFSHFNDKLPTELQKPFVVHLEDNKPSTEVSVDMEPEYNYLYINSDFSNVWRQANLLSTIEDFLKLYPKWKIVVSKGWGALDSFQVLSQQAHWQNKGQFKNWLVSKHIPWSRCHLILDLSSQLTESLFYIQQALNQEIPCITTHSKDLLQYLPWKLDSIEGLWFIDNFQGSLFEKLLLVTEFKDKRWVHFTPSSNNSLTSNDLAINAFNRSMNKF